MKNQKIFDILLSLNSEQSNNFKKLKNTCTDIKCACLLDYFWKIVSKKSNFLTIEKKEYYEDQTITIISASQTNNAKSLSQRLHKKLNKNNIKNYFINAINYKFKKIKDEKILILIISTQEEVEVPGESVSFYKFLISKKALKLDNLYYSIFGLGDISYNFFCHVAKGFDNRFKKLGVKSLLNRFDSDIEYEDNYKKLSQKPLISLNKNITTLKYSLSYLTEKNQFTITNVSYNQKNPAIGTILTNQKITSRYSSKEIRHIAIDIHGLNINYTPGDALGVWYQNNSNLVEKTLKSLCINLSDQVNIQNNITTIFDALKNNFELTVNTKKIVKSYAYFSNSKFLKNIISDEKKLNKYVFETPLVSMIWDNPSKISSQELVSFLRPLTPRLYSISSSQAKINNEIHITVGIVKKIISECVYLGGASDYFAHSLKLDDKIKFFIKNNNNFRLPINTNTPIIMISSGTGIAPFRAFMQQRDHDESKGKNWIFFGNQNFTEDFLYQIEWQEYIKKGLLTKMSLAWSRDQEYKIYIQDKIRENGKEIWDWIENGAQIYICGNASQMAKDVEKELLNIISHHGGMNIEDSNEFLNNLRLIQRYQRDVY